MDHEMNPTEQARNWIMENLASKNNYALLSTFYSYDPYFSNTNNNRHFDAKTTQLLNLTQLRNAIEHTTYDSLISLIQHTNIFSSYHLLYPAILSNEQSINAMTKQQAKELSAWVARLFQNEIELKVQIILSTNHWRNNYIEHKKLNDQLLHENHYKNIHSTNVFIPSADVITFISKCANGMTYIRRIHQQLNYLGQQCTKPNVNLNNTSDAIVHKINEFLNKHKHALFKQKILKCLDVAQNTISEPGKDFLTRLARADIPAILAGDCTETASPCQQSIMLCEDISQPQSQPQTVDIEILYKPTKYGLRTVVDVQISDNWCEGTIIKKFDDGSIKVALHCDELDENGAYKYDTHYTIKYANLCKGQVVHCINEDGEYEMDYNRALLVDSTPSIVEFSSPVKQEQIRHEKEILSQQSAEKQSFDEILANRNRNRNNSGHDDNVIRNLETELSGMDIDNTDHNNNNENKEEKKEVDVDVDVADNQSKSKECVTTDAIIISQASDITEVTEPTLSNELSPNTINKKINERKEQFKIRHSNNKNTKASKRRSPSPRRKKRNRNEFEKKIINTNNKNKKNKDNNNPLKRRKIQTRSMTAAAGTVAKKSDENNNEGSSSPQPQQRRQSPRLLERRNSEIEREKQREIQAKKKKKKIQTTIGGNKQKNMMVVRDKKKDNENENENESVETIESEGEEQQWSDDMSDDMKILNKRSRQDERNKNNPRKKPKCKWTTEQENALKKCYAKHDKARKLVKNYAIWDQIKRDSEYCHHWTNRSAHALRDKARLLLKLNKK